MKSELRLAHELTSHSSLRLTAMQQRPIFKHCVIFRHETVWRQLSYFTTIQVTYMHYVPEQGDVRTDPGLPKAKIKVSRGGIEWESHVAWSHPRNKLDWRNIQPCCLDKCFLEDINSRIDLLSVNVYSGHLSTGSGSSVGLTGSKCISSESVSLHTFNILDFSTLYYIRRPCSSRLITRNLVSRNGSPLRFFRNLNVYFTRNKTLARNTGAVVVDIL